MIKIEKDSIITKDNCIKNILKQATEVGFNHSLTMVRGSVYKTEEIHLQQLIMDEKSANTIKSIIYECKKNKKSMHQVDFLIFAVMSDTKMVKVDAKDLSFEEVKVKLNEAILKKEVESSSKIIIFVLSEEDGEMLIYDVIDSVDKEGNVSVLISPEPISKVKEKADKTKIIIGAVPIPDFFEINKNDVVPELIHKISKKMFKEDAKYFTKPSEFIEKRNKKKVKNKPVKQKKAPRASRL